MVGGTTPGKGGQRDANGLPIFETMHDAVKATAATATMIFVPPPYAGDAIIEAADAGVGLICAITEGVPVLDMVKVKEALKAYPKSTLIGPNCPGIISPGLSNAGIIPADITKPGRIGLVGKRDGRHRHRRADQGRGDLDQRR